MGATNQFNLDIQLKEWTTSISACSALSPEDVLEMQSHLLDIHDSLCEVGLSEEEAFLVAVNRMGNAVNWEHEFVKANHIWLNTKKIVTVIAGICFYHFSYFFILFLAKLSIVVGRMLGYDYKPLLKFCDTVLMLPFLLLIWGAIGILIKEKKIFQILQNVNFQLKHVVLVFVGTVIFGLLDRLILPFYHRYVTDAYVKYSFHESFVYFEYLYPLLMLVMFLTIHYAYYKKKNKVQDYL